MYQKLNQVRYGLQLKSIIRRRIDADISLVSCARNERFRLRAFLDYYRRLGVEHFFMIDNDSTDGSLDFLAQQPDCSVWHTSYSYKNSNFGMEWCNYILSKYLSGKWTICCDPDEFLIFPSCEQRNVKELVRYMERIDQTSLFCAMIDTYPKGSVEASPLLDGQDPLEVAPYFDKTTYSQRMDSSGKSLWMQGGVRMRINFRNDPAQAPALNKVPLIKWRKKFRYTSSMHETNDPSVNYNLRNNPRGVSGCLLHFKFVSSVLEKAKEESVRNQHYAGGVEYKTYLNSMHSLYKEGISVRYENSKQVEQMGFMQRGAWF